MVRDAGGELEAVLVLGTLGAPRRAGLRGRRGKKVEEAGAEPVPTSRATVVRPHPFDSPDEAERWLESLRKEEDARDEQLGRALTVLNRALHAHRVASADPTVPHVSPDRALVVRLGYGGGEAVAEGRYAGAWELPRE